MIIRFVLLYIVALISHAQEILPAEKAFIPTLNAENNTLNIDFDIADEYYLYRDKITVRALDDTKIGKTIFAKSIVKNDDFFGRVNVYYNNANLKLPIITTADTIELEISFQGCWDGGICYPPVIQKHIVAVNNNSKPAANKQNFLGSILSKNQTKDPVSVDAAFDFTATKINNDALAFSWDIRKDYYLYANKFDFNISGAEFGDINFPPGQQHNDIFFGDIEIYRNQLDIVVPLNDITDEVIINIGYQGCWDGGICYPPANKTKKFDFSKQQTAPIITTKAKQSTQNLAIADKAKQSTQNITTAEKNTPTNTIINSVTNENTANLLSEEDKIINIIKTDSFLAIIILFFGFGLALSFTPCVLPMVPILSSLIVGQGNISRKKAFLISLTFVISMSLTYTVIGVIAGLFGQKLQVILQNMYVLIGFSLIFIALAFSMFGYFEISLPHKMQNYLTKITNNQKGGSFIGVAIMGLLSALIVSPCIAAPLSGSLIYIGQTGDAVLGGAALFAMSLGMGILLLVVGSGIGSVPKTGKWMDAVKHIFGVILLGMAIYMIERVIPEYYSLILWALLFTIAPIVLEATFNNNSANYFVRIYKALLLITFIYGLLLIILIARGGFDSGGTMSAPLKNMFATSSEFSKNNKQFKKVVTLTEFNDEVVNHDIAMLEFYADWCTYCKEYERNIFTDVNVANTLNNFALLKADITQYNNNDKEIMDAFSVFAPPTILFFKNGVEIKHKRIVGELSKEEFLQHISSIN